MGQSIVEAARHYVAFLKAEQAREDAIMVKAAIADYLAAKSQEQTRDEISPLTLADLKVSWGLSSRPSQIVG